MRYWSKFACVDNEVAQLIARIMRSDVSTKSRSVSATQKIYCRHLERPDESIFLRFLISAFICSMRVFVCHVEIKTTRSCANECKKKRNYWSGCLCAQVDSNSLAFAWKHHFINKGDNKWLRRRSTTKQSYEKMAQNMLNIFIFAQFFMTHVLATSQAYQKWL